MMPQEAGTASLRLGRATDAGSSGYTHNAPSVARAWVKAEGGGFLDGGDEDALEAGVVVDDEVAAVGGGSRSGSSTARMPRRSRVLRGSIPTRFSGSVCKSRILTDAHIFPHASFRRLHSPGWLRIHLIFMRNYAAPVPSWNFLHVICITTLNCFMM